MAEYLTISDFICDKTVAKTKLQKIHELRDALLDAYGKALGNSDVQDITFNDGQTVIKTMFRSPDQILKSMYDLDKLEVQITNRCFGRMQTMRQYNTFRKRG